MIRYFCDGCEKEIEGRDDVVTHRIKRKAFFNGTHFWVEVMVAIEGTWNRGHLCESCTLRVVNAGSGA